MNYTTDKIKVRYHETDQMGIVHHSNYLKFFELITMMDNPHLISFTISNFYYVRFIFHFFCYMKELIVFPTNLCYMILNKKKLIINR